MASVGRLSGKIRMTRRAFVAWLALCALFAQALMPLTQALAYDVQADGELQVICTANGVQTIAIGEDGKPLEPADTVSCPFCTVHKVPGTFSGGIASIIQPDAFSKQAFAQPTAHTLSSIWRGIPRPPRAPPLSV